MVMTIWYQKNESDSHNSIEQRALKYRSAIQLPPELREEERTGFALLMIVESNKITKNRQIKPDAK